ncbi:MAG: hypothetical protein DRJ05_14800 [Bacteroidetes bacterium]|nr:MAG: hypothetical protein DRJ05_14800 [Bacteroidota bacterium]
MQTPEIETEIKVYPNPARDYVVFSSYANASEDKDAKSRIMMFDVFGQMVKQLPITSEKTVWNTREVKDGIYFYRSEIKGKVLSGKVVVQK